MEFEIFNRHFTSMSDDYYLGHGDCRNEEEFSICIEGVLEQHNVGLDSIIIKCNIEDKPEICKWTNNMGFEFVFAVMGNDTMKIIGVNTYNEFVEQLEQFEKATGVKKEDCRYWTDDLHRFFPNPEDTMDWKSFSPLTDQLWAEEEIL